jgi:hypothetical protein
MADVGGYSPATAKLIYDVVRYLNSNGFVIEKKRGTGNVVRPPEYIYVKNTSGEVVPGYACMQAVGTVDHGEQTYVEIDKPADIVGTAGAFLFNGPQQIEIGGYGISFPGPMVRALFTAGSGRCSPIVNDWELTADADGIFVAAGADIVGTDVAKVFCCVNPVITQQVVTDVRVDGLTLQKKTRDVLVFPVTAESAWTSWHTGAECEDA